MFVNYCELLNDQIMCEEEKAFTQYNFQSSNNMNTKKTKESGSSVFTDIDSDTSGIL